MGQTIRIFALSVLALAEPCEADDTDGVAREPEEIVVEGQRGDEIERFVQSLAEPGFTDQLPRWMTRVCVAVAGVVPAHAEIVSRRVSELAEAVELAPATLGCRPKVSVMFAPDADAVAAELVDRYAVQLGVNGRGRLVAFAGSDRPVRWLAVEDKCGDGCTLSNSRIRKSTTPALSLMIIVIDNTAIAGYDIDEIADYVAMVTLVNPSQDAAHPRKSILSMFERPRPTGAVFAVTDYDHAFLSGLYRSDPSLGSKLQRARIEQVMHDTLE